MHVDRSPYDDRPWITGIYLNLKIIIAAIIKIIIIV